jgi:hypothetical protein
MAAASRPALRLVIDPTPTSTPYAFEMGTIGVDFSQPLAMWRCSDLEVGITVKANCSLLAASIKLANAVSPWA